MTIIRLLITASVVLVAESAYAQTEHGFVGAGVLGASEDREDRTRFPHDSPGDHRLWLIEGTAFVRPRFGIGGEWVTLGTIEGGTSGSSFTITDRQQESVLLALIRGRAGEYARLSLDFVAAAGLLLQHRETEQKPCPLGITCSGATTTIEDRRSPGFALGADVQVALARHVAVSVPLRVYFLNRGDLESLNVVRHASIRPAVGISGRATW